MAPTQQAQHPWKVSHDPIDVDRSALFKQMWKVIPESERAEIASLRQEQDDREWRLGDLANRWYEIIVANELPATKLDVCALVAHCMDHDQLGASSIEKYSYQAQFFTDPEVRVYYGILPASHFRYAMGWGDDWQKILDYDMSRIDKTGSIPSLKQLVKHFEPEQQPPAAPPPIDPDLTPLHIGTNYDLPPEHTPSRGAGVVERIRSDTVRLRDDLQQLQREQPQLASTIAKILRLCEEALSRIR